MKALFVDGPAAGQEREYPYATTTIAILERIPLSLSEVVSGNRQAARTVTYVKFATDHAGRSLFKVGQ